MTAGGLKVAKVGAVIFALGATAAVVIWNQSRYAPESTAPVEVPASVGAEPDAGAEAGAGAGAEAEAEAAAGAEAEAEAEAAPVPELPPPRRVFIPSSKLADFGDLGAVPAPADTRDGGDDARAVYFSTSKSGGFDLPPPAPRVLNPAPQPQQQGAPK